MSAAFAPLIATAQLVLLARALMTAWEPGDPGSDPNGPPGNPAPYDPGPAPAPPPYVAPPEFPGPGSSNNPAATLYNAEDDFVLGQDGIIYQRQRDGFRTLGYRAVGRSSDIGAAAAAAGMNPAVLEQEIHKQEQAQQSANWATEPSASDPSLTNQQVQQMVQGGQDQYANQDLAWNAAASGYNGLTNYQLQQANKTASGNVAAADYAWKQGAASWTPVPGQTSPGGAANTMSTLGGGFLANGGSNGSDNAMSTQGAASPWTNQSAEQALQSAKDQSGWNETQYGLSTMAAQHNLENQQRDLNTQQSAFGLAQEAQRQAVEKYKQNQTQYEQTQGSTSRDVSGFGWAAMNPAAGTRLAGS